MSLWCPWTKFIQLVFHVSVVKRCFLVAPPTPQSLCCLGFSNVTEQTTSQNKSRVEKSSLKAPQSVASLFPLLFCQCLSIQQEQPEARTSLHSLSASQGVLLHSLLFCLSAFFFSFSAFLSASRGRNKLGKQDRGEDAHRLCSKSQTVQWRAAQR